MIRSCLLVGFTLCMASAAIAQPPKQPATSALCTRTQAIDNTKEQILFTRTFDRSVQRIAVLLRAADLLWPHDQERSVATFMEAFDLAVQDFKEQGDQTRRTSQTQYAAVIALPDQRFKVISALARRDPVKAPSLKSRSRIRKIRRKRGSCLTRLPMLRRERRRRSCPRAPSLRWLTSTQNLTSIVALRNLAMQ